MRSSYATTRTAAGQAGGFRSAPRVAARGAPSSAAPKAAPAARRQGSRMAALSLRPLPPSLAPRATDACPRGRFPDSASGLGPSISIPAAKTDRFLLFIFV